LYLGADNDTDPETDGICDDVLHLIQVIQHQTESEHIDNNFEHTDKSCQITSSFQCQYHPHRGKSDVKNIDDQNYGNHDIYITQQEDILQSTCSKVFSII